jgi:hypothetical protein
MDVLKELTDDEEDDNRVPFFFGPTVLSVWSMALDPLLANGSVLQCRNQKSDISAQPSTSCLAANIFR